MTDPGPEAVVYAVSPYYLSTITPWQERDLKWTNAPSISGTPQGFTHPIKKGRWIELDVTAAVQGAIANGHDQVCFALTNSSRNLISFASKDEVRHAPELVVISN